MNQKDKLLPKQAIEEYRKIYKKKFNILLKFEEAEIKANNFINLLALLSTNNPTLKVVRGLDATGDLDDSK